jgi:AraC family transcriptional regulator, transcriptional activator of the genes for pyochelin and ferripyochelin receptors
MAIHILWSDREQLVIKPFSKALPARTVQLWCKVHANTCNITLRNTIRSKKLPGDVVVEFTIDEFASLAKLSAVALNNFLKQFKSRSSPAFSAQPIVINAAMHQCIYRIRQNRESVLQSLALVIELLALMESQYTNAQSSRRSFIRNEYDKERIIYARDYLLTHMDAPPSLPQLAAVVGINEFKLKRGFKELFNQPPFAYLADVRLEMARTALRKKEKTITQIAFELGYASLQHFSMAFKKKYGVAPAKFT